MKIKTKELVKTLYRDGTLIERKFYPDRYSLIEFGGQLFKIENPEGKGVKITQVERRANDGT